MTIASAAQNQPDSVTLTVAVIPDQDTSAPGLAASERFPQVSPTPETAGVQAASITSDRAAISVQIFPPLDRILPAIGALLPSTGGPSLALASAVLLVIGSLGIFLRRIGRAR